MSRHVRGVLFVDYVRMIRAHPSVDFSKLLTEEDRAHLAVKVDLEGWYSMESFERFGVAILREVAQGQVDAVRMWGRFQTDALAARFPDIVAAGDPRETLFRFQVLRSRFFDYDALAVSGIDDESATVRIAYGMGPVAEEAAAHQAKGFFERLLELAGSVNVFTQFRHKAWEGADATSLELTWQAPG